MLTGCLSLGRRSGGDWVNKEHWVGGGKEVLQSSLSTGICSRRSVPTEHSLSCSRLASDWQAACVSQLHSYLTCQRLVWRWTTGWTVRGPNLRGDKNFPHPSRLALGPHPASCTVQGFAGSLPQVKRSGHGAEVKERVKVKLYSPSGSSWPVYGVNCTFYLVPLHVQAMSVIPFCPIFRDTHPISWDLNSFVPTSHKTRFPTPKCLWFFQTIMTVPFWQRVRKFWPSNDGKETSVVLGQPSNCQ